MDGARSVTPVKLLPRTDKKRRLTTTSSTGGSRDALWKISQADWESNATLSEVAETRRRARHQRRWSTPRCFLEPTLPCSPTKALRGEGSFFTLVHPQSFNHCFSVSHSHPTLLSTRARSAVGKGPSPPSCMTISQLVRTNSDPPSVTVAQLDLLRLGTCVCALPCRDAPLHQDGHVRPT